MPVRSEISCPECVETMEIFLKDGKTAGDGECPEYGNMIPEKAVLDL